MSVPRAREDFDGISYEAALNRLIDEHEMQQVHAAYARLPNDSEQWADYQQELRLAENTAADGLSDARDEYPEYKPMTRAAAIEPRQVQLADFRAFGKGYRSRLKICYGICLSLRPFEPKEA